MTKTIKLLSGVPCEIGELTGKHQRWLTEGGAGGFEKKLTRVLADVVKSIGSISPVSEQVINSLFAADKKKLLVEVRNYTMDNDPEFRFMYTYRDRNGVKQEDEQVIDISEGFPEKLFYKQWDELEAIEKDVTVTLPKSGIQVIFTMLDGHGELIGAATKESERSFHTPVSMRKPRVMTETANGFTPIKLDLDKLSYKDLEFLKAEIKRHEGKVDTEWQFDHPETKQPITLDILSQPVFFFPSEAI